MKILVFLNVLGFISLKLNVKFVRIFIREIRQLYKKYDIIK